MTMARLRVRVLASKGFEEWMQPQEMMFELPDWPDPLVWVSWEFVREPACTPGCWCASYHGPDAHRAT